MGFNEKVHAFIAAKFYVHLTEQFGERGRLLSSTEPSITPSREPQSAPLSVSSATSRKQSSLRSSFSIFRAISAGSAIVSESWLKSGFSFGISSIFAFRYRIFIYISPFIGKGHDLLQNFYLYQIIANTCKLQILAKRKYIRCVWYFRLAIFQTSKIRCSARLLYCVSGFSRNSGFLVIVPPWRG